MQLLKKSLTALAAIALSGVSAQAQPQPGAVDSAREMLRTGHPDEALALVDPVIAQAMLNEAKEPDAICPGVLVATLQAFMKDGMTVSVGDDWCEAMLLKGYALNELKRPAEAAQVLKTLVGHDPDNANYLAEYAFTVGKTGDAEGSLALYKQTEKLAEKIKDRDSSAHWQAVALRGQGFNYAELQRWDEATKAYQRSLRFEPDSELARNELKYIEEHRPR